MDARGREAKSCCQGCAMADASPRQSTLRTPIPARAPADPSTKSSRCSRTCGSARCPELNPCRDYVARFVMRKNLLQCPVPDRGAWDGKRHTHECCQRGCAISARHKLVLCP